MKKARMLFLTGIFCLAAGAALADMAAYINGGVSGLNPTIGLNAEFQYGYASIAMGAGIMQFNDFGLAVGVRGYLFGLDGGPYFEVIYGTTGEDPVQHTGSNNNVVTDSVTVYQGISGLAGWRSFFGDGWNMTLGAGVRTMFPKQGGLSRTLGRFVFNVTAGVMFWGDEAAQKNAEKYGKSFHPPEPGTDEIEPEMPGPDEGTGVEVPLAEMQAGAEWITPVAEPATPAGQAITPAAEAITAAAQAITPAAEAITPAAKTIIKPAKKAKATAKTVAAPVKVTGAAKTK
jgi:hypothetical protein